MSTLGHLFGIGRGALQSHQSRMATLQNNIANASTPGYRRQRVDLVTLGGQFGETSLRGVHARGPESARAHFLDSQLHTGRADFGFHSARATFTSGVEAALMPAPGVHLGQDVEDFFSSLRSLSVDPGSDIGRRGFLHQADHLSARFRDTATALATQRHTIQDQATGLLDSINQDLAEIASLDRQIQQATRLSQPAGELLDHRDRLIADVSEHLSLKVVPGDDGSVDLISPRGRALMEGGQARALSLDPSGLPGALRLLLQGTEQTAQPLDTPGGTLGALVTTYNDTLGREIQRLDELAFAFATELNALHTAGFDRDGAPGEELFLLSPTPQGAAASLRLNPDLRDRPRALALAGDPAEAPGGSSNLQQLLALQDQPLLGGASLQESLRAGVHSVAQELASSRRAAESSSASLAQLEAFEASLTGVSLEEEMIALSQSQRGFEAAMKVMQATDQMFQSLLSLKG